MEKLTFHRFPELPIEIRELVLVAAIHPRLVHIQPASSSSPQVRLRQENPATFTSSSPDYVFSTSPIPPLLHTCQESRELLARHGYRLAFGVWDDIQGHKATPRVWFNFDHDALYLGLDQRYFISFRAWPRRHYIDYCSPRDRRCVKMLALLHHEEWRSLADQGSLIDSFANLEHVLLVEQHINYAKSMHRVDKLDTAKDENQDCWGFLECDIADELGHIFGSRIPPKYIRRIIDYQQTTGTWGRDFFQALAQAFQEDIGKNWRSPSGAVVTVLNSVVTQMKLRRHIPLPTVCLVSVVRRSHAEQILRQRRAFWERIQIIEYREAEFGPWDTEPEDLHFEWMMAEDMEHMYESERQ